MRSGRQFRASSILRAGIHEGDPIVVRGAPLLLSSGDRIDNGTSLQVTAVDEDHDQLTAVRAGGETVTLDLAAGRESAPYARRPALRLAYAMHPNPAQGATVARTATLGHPIADRNAVYVADTRARYGHTVHLAREDLGTDGTTPIGSTATPPRSPKRVPAPRASATPGI